MMYAATGHMLLAADQQIKGPEVAVAIAFMVGIVFLIGIAVAAWLEFRKTKIAAAQEDAMRQLVARYEQLATTTFDAQQRVAADVAELRSRTASIEQILRTVE
jgi:flagellar basal body-associated protein FliL